MKNNGQFHHIISEAYVDDDKLYINIDGKEYTFELRSLTNRLKNATSEQLKKFKISPSGYGIHWQELDEDISIDALLGIIHQPPISAGGKK